MTVDVWDSQQEPPGTAVSVNSVNTRLTGKIEKQ